MKNRDEIQKEIINKIVENNFRGIILGAVRLGKTRILLECTKKLNNPSILVLYPNIDIKNAWVDECNGLDYNPNIVYSTFISMQKLDISTFDIVIVDEAHLLSENQLDYLSSEITPYKKRVLLASGTYSDKTLLELKQKTGLRLIVNYGLDNAINDGLVNDYNIYIHQYALDEKTPVTFGTKRKWVSTDKKESNRLSYKVDIAYGSEKKFAAINRMRFINSNNTLVRKVKNWIKENEKSRYILFAPDEKTGKLYGLPMFNSKSTSTEVIDDFKQEKINQICLIKKGGTGGTYKNLNKIVLTYINSNGENLIQFLGRSLLKDTEESEIHIFVSTEEYQQKWLKEALKMQNTKRINYINEK